MIICENCGKQCESNNIIVSVKNGCDISFYCRECNNLFGHCPMCSNYGPCGFFDDPDPMPQFKVIARQMRQGNATFIERQQVPNADRIKKFCLDGKCKCYNGDDEHPLCCRHGGYATCTNYCEKETHNFVQDFSMQKASEN